MDFENCFFFKLLNDSNGKLGIFECGYLEAIKETEPSVRYLISSLIEDFKSFFGLD